MPKTPHLNVLLMASHRHYLLELILKQIREEFPRHHIILNVDRPSSKVAKFALKHQHDDDVTVTQFGPVVTEDGEFFSQARNSMLNAARDTGAMPGQYCMVWDDDQIWSQCGLLRRRMEQGVDVMSAQDLFFWDDPHTVATHGFLLKHVAPQVFKLLHDDWFNEECIKQAPDGVLAEGTKTTLSTPLLNYGLFTEAERRRTFGVYKEAGKIDKFTMSFVAEPTLVEYRPDRKDNWVYRAAQHLKEQGL